MRSIRHTRKAVIGFAATLALVAVAMLGGAGSASASHRDAGNVVFLSNQLAQVSEIDAVHKYLVNGFPGSVDYVVPPVGQGQVWFDRITAEAQGRQRHGELARRSARRLPDGPAVPHEPQRRREAAEQGRHPAGPDEARQARDEQAALHPMDAGDVHHGRQQAGAEVPAEGREHQRAHLRPAPPVGEEHEEPDGAGALRDAGRHERPDQPLPPGLPRAVLQRGRRDDVQEPGRDRRLELHEAAVAVHASAVALLQLHAGPAPERRGLGGLGSRRASHERAEDSWERLRRLPGAEGAEGSRLHAGARRPRDPEDGAEPVRGQAADQVDEQRPGAGAGRSAPSASSPSSARGCRSGSGQAS